jgi:hypothetical protein
MSSFLRFQKFSAKMISTKIFLIHVLTFVSLLICGKGSQNDFKVLKNQDIAETAGESGFISNLYKPSRVQCMSICSENQNCKTAVYHKSQERLTNCFTYNRYFQTCELIPSSTGDVYEKKSNSQSKIFNLVMLHTKK